MVDDFRSLRDGLLRALLGQINPQSSSGDTHSDNSSGAHDRSSSSGGDEREDSSAADARRALLGALFAKAGKGKDEVVQIIGREIGQAVAAMLKEPLARIADNSKLQISFEFVPKDQSTVKKSEARKKSRRKRRFPRAKT